MNRHLTKARERPRAVDQVGGSSDQLPWLNTGASTRGGASQLSQSALGLMFELEKRSICNE